eukprot:2350959-Pleurochrysis_carterae.AAC.1
MEMLASSGCFKGNDDKYVRIACVHLNCFRATNRFESTLVSSGIACMRANVCTHECVGARARAHMRACVRARAGQSARAKHAQLGAERVAARPMVAVC